MPGMRLHDGRRQDKGERECEPAEEGGVHRAFNSKPRSKLEYDRMSGLSHLGPRASRPHLAQKNVSTALRRHTSEFHGASDSRKKNAAA
jgi:hypothetical protein